GMCGAEELFGTVDGELLDVVDDADALVVASSRIAFCVLDVEMSRQAVQHGLRSVVFARDEIERAGVPLTVALDQRVDLGIDAIQRSGGPRGEGHVYQVGSVLLYNWL